MLAALARREQLLLRIEEIDPRWVRDAEPQSLGAVMSENARLARILESMQHRAAVSPARAIEDGELAPVVCDDDAAAGGEAPIDGTPAERVRVRRALFMVAALVPVIALLVWSVPDEKPRLAARPPHDATTVHLSGVVVSRAGAFDAREGERCEITITDSGDRDSGRKCDIEARCPRAQQAFIALSCPIGDPKSPVRLQSNGIDIDEQNHLASFILGWHGEVTKGGATLRLDTPR